MLASVAEREEEDAAWAYARHVLEQQGNSHFLMFIIFRRMLHGPMRATCKSSKVT